MKRQLRGLSRDDGFTLMETLVSIMLLALVVAFLPGLLQLGTRALQARTELDAISAAGPARQFIAQQLAGARSALQRRSDGRLQLAFDGRRDALAFVAPASLGAQQTGMQDYRFELAADENGRGTARRTLSVAMRPFALEAKTPATRAVLIRDVATLNFRYFGRRSSEGSARWHDEWIDARTLPKLVEMRIGLVNPQPAAERPLVVELRLSHEN